MDWARWIGRLGNLYPSNSHKMQTSFLSSHSLLLFSSIILQGHKGSKKFIEINFILPKITRETIHQVFPHQFPSMWYQLISQSVENSEIFKFHNNLLEGLRVDQKTFLGLAMPNQYRQTVEKKM